MRIKKISWFLIFLFAFNVSFIGKTLALEKEEQGLLRLLQKTERSNWQEKDKIIRKWNKEIRQRRLQLSDDEKTKLIEMFEKESKFQEEYINNLKKQGFSDSKARNKFLYEYRKKGYYADYFINFALLVYSFKDTRAIPSLLKGLHYYGGAIVPTHIIAIGEDAVEPLIELLTSEDKTLRNTAFAVLATWVNAPIVTEDYSIDESLSIKDAKLLDRIKISFTKALHDKESEVRRRAVGGLGAFPEEEVIRELEEVSKNDPYSYYSEYEKKTKYPVRVGAKRTIEKLKTKMKNREPQK